MPSSSKKEWQENVLRPSIKKFPERQDRFETSSQAEVEALYTPEDLKDFEYNRSLGYPGGFPFTRGIQPTMYRGRLWTMRQYAGFASAEESNKRYRFLLEQGQTGLSIAFDLPTQIGYDSDHSRAHGEVGKVGVPISTLKDMEVLFQGIPLDKISTSMTTNATAPAYTPTVKKQCLINKEIHKELRGRIYRPQSIRRGIPLTMITLNKQVIIIPDTRR